MAVWPTDSFDLKPSCVWSAKMVVLQAYIFKVNGKDTIDTKNVDHKQT